MVTRGTTHNDNHWWAKPLVTLDSLMDHCNTASEDDGGPDMVDGRVGRKLFATLVRIQLFVEPIRMYDGRKEVREWNNSQAEKAERKKKALIVEILASLNLA